MKLSLIITTYNRHNTLELAIRSALKQSYIPNEIIIADDGSNNLTKKLIEDINHELKFHIKHIWQEDKGFRAAMIRNRAIAVSNSDYIIIVDGDMILERNFIFDHIKNSKQGRFIQGSRVILDKDKTEDAILSKQLYFKFYEKGIKNRCNSIRSDTLSKIFSKEKNYLKGIKTCNMSFFKKDCININGFNESFIGWGREDSEFAVRLMNSGINRYTLKFNAIAYHLWHQENSRSKLDKNDIVLQKTINTKLKWCKNGIDKYLRKNIES